MHYDIPGSYDYHKHSWFSPYLVIKATNRVAKLYGSNIEFKREFKLVREMFDSAIALLGAYNLHPDNKYIMQPNLQSDSPDVVAVKLTEVKDEPILLEVTQLEIVRMNEYSSTDDVVEFLKSTKLSSKKSYDSKTLIVCVISKKIQLNRLKIADDLQKIKPKPTIYILGKFTDSEDKWAIFCPYPKPTQLVTYSLSETIGKYQIPEVINLGIGMAKKITYQKTDPKLTTIYDIFNLEERSLEKYKKNID